ncbi:MAG: pyruvoyl-dependent arginine decarboxylase [Candidatus Bathyarchaeia archaeon]
MPLLEEVNIIEMAGERIEVFLPRAYFVTSGEGLSAESPLNAFDNALRSAGVDACNLVYVSSIIPKDAVEVKRRRITPGTITFAVVARMDGDEGEVIGAGIGYSKCENKTGPTYGFVAENHGYKDSKTIEDELMGRLQRMASSRGLKLVNPKVVSKSMRVPKDRYGCCVVAFIYLPHNLYPRNEVKE